MTQSRQSILFIHYRVCNPATEFLTTNIEVLDTDKLGGIYHEDNQNKDTKYGRVERPIETVLTACKGSQSYIEEEAASGPWIFLVEDAWGLMLDPSMDHIATDKHLNLVTCPVCRKDWRFIEACLEEIDDGSV